MSKILQMGLKMMNLEIWKTSAKIDLGFKFIEYKFKVEIIDSI